MKFLLESLFGYSTVQNRNFLKHKIITICVQNIIFKQTLKFEKFEKLTLKFKDLYLLVITLNRLNTLGTIEPQKKT